MIGDTLDEVNEQFRVNLSNPDFAEIADATAIGTITDNDPPPSISVADAATQSEGDAVSAFQMTLSAPSGKSITVSYATANGSAQAPGDYTAKSGTVTFNPGQTTKTISVASVEDSLDETDETFTFAISDPAPADPVTIADSSGSATITDDDLPPSVAVADPTTAPEGDASQFAVTLSGPSGKSITVSYATSNATAKAPGDYTQQTGTLTFDPGQTTKTVNVATVEDALDERDERFRLTISDPAPADPVTIADSNALATIADDDPPPTISINDISRSEGANPMRFTVSLSGPSAKQVKVNFATADGTALAPGDYTHTTGTVIFQPGATSKDVTVISVEDAIDEPNETYTVALSSPVNGGFGDASGTGTINDDD